MSFKKALVLSSFVIAFLFLYSHTQAQNSSIIRLTFKSDKEQAPPQYIKIGNCIGGSYAIDSILKFQYVGTEYCEFEVPVLPPGFAVTVRDLPDRPRAANGINNDFRGYDPTQVDTFLFEVTDPEAGDADNLTIKWQSSSELAARCDSMFLINLKDPFDPGDDIKTNMFETESLYVPQYAVWDPSPQMSYIIYKYGVRLIDTIPGLVGPTIVREGRSIVPKEFGLYSNYPNPFNPSTQITFDLPYTSIVTLKVFNMLGQEVATIVDREKFESGMNAVEFSAVDRNASGVYLYRIVAEQIGNEGLGKTFTQVKKMVLVK